MRSASGTPRGDVLTIIETSSIRSPNVNKISVHEILGSSGCRIVKGSYHPSDWVLVLPTGGALRMRAATRLDTGASVDPRDRVCIDIGTQPIERVSVERDEAKWFNVDQDPDGARVDPVAMTRLNDAGLVIDDHLDHLTPRQWSNANVRLAVAVARTDTLLWRFNKEPKQDPWGVQEHQDDGPPAAKA